MFVLSHYHRSTTEISTHLDYSFRIKVIISLPLYPPTKKSKNLAAHLDKTIKVPIWAFINTKLLSSIICLSFGVSVTHSAGDWVAGVILVLRTFLYYKQFINRYLPCYFIFHPLQQQSFV